VNLWLYNIFKKDDGLYYVLRDDGRHIAKRRRFSHAVEIRDVLLFGGPRPSEREQILRDCKEFKIIERSDSQFRYFVVDNMDVPVRWYKHLYQAKWFLAQVRKKQGALSAPSPSPALSGADAVDDHSRG